MPDGRVCTSCVSCGSFSIIDCFDSIPLVSFAIDRNGNIHIASLHFCVFFSQKSFQLEATDGCDHTGSQISYVESVVHLWNIKLNKKLKELPRLEADLCHDSPFRKVRSMQLWPLPELNWKVLLIQLWPLPELNWKVRLIQLWPLPELSWPEALRFQLHPLHQPSFQQIERNWENPDWFLKINYLPMPKRPIEQGKD